MTARFPATAAIFFVRLYQRFVSPFLGNNCRFYPSCSQYGIEAFSKHGFCKGLLLTVARIARCGPWHPGGFDPVPEKAFPSWERLARRIAKTTTKSGDREEEIFGRR